MRNIGFVLGRELGAYFATPLAYIFIVIFLVLAGTLTFFVGGFLERGQADLQAFFSFHPWLYLFLVPALSMRLWAEERRTGSIELLLTMPVTMSQAVIGKYLAAWLFTGIALLLSAPIWVKQWTNSSPLASSPTKPATLTCAPKLARFAATLAAPPGATSCPLYWTTGIGASREIRRVVPKIDRSRTRSPNKRILQALKSSARTKAARSLILCPYWLDSSVSTSRLSARRSS